MMDRIYHWLGIRKCTGFHCFFLGDGELTGPKGVVTGRPCGRSCALDWEKTEDGTIILAKDNEVSA